MSKIEIHEQAEIVRQHFIAAGVEVSYLSCSTNRNGDHSAYFSGMGRKFRVSDHPCNTDYRDDVQLVRDMSFDEVVAWVADAKVRDAVAAEKARIERELAAEQEVARKAELNAVADAAQRRKSAWLAHLASFDTNGWTQTTINKIEKEWRKANPITAFA